VMKDFLTKLTDFALDTFRTRRHFGYYHSGKCLLKTGALIIKSTPRQRKGARVITRR
jgi:hypothetical protein